MIAPRPHIAGMAAYALADLKAPAGKRLISLAQNEAAHAPSPLALAAARDVIGGSALYPDPDWNDLRSVIADVHGIAREGILCGAGSLDLIACLMQCFIGPGDSVLASEHSYAFFRTAAIAAGGAYKAAPEQEFTVSVDALLGAVNASTRIVCVANPGNPTGTRIPNEELRRLREELDPGILLVIDEAYGEFSDGPGVGVFDLVGRGDTVVLRTFSKAYGLAGMRVGWGLFPAAVGGEVRKVLNPNNISAASQAAAAAAMRDQDYMRRACAETADRRDRFAARLRDLGFGVPDSHTNFVLVRFGSADEAQAADAVLRAQSVFMRGMGGYGLPDCLRATIGAEEDMQLAGDLLAKWRGGTS